MTFELFQNNLNYEINVFNTIEKYKGIPSYEPNKNKHIVDQHIH